MGRAVGRSALAAILNSTVPLLVIVIAPLFLPDEPIRVNGLLGLAIGSRGRPDHVAGPAARAGTAAGTIALLGSSLSYAIGNVYARRNVRGLAPLIPAVFQVTFALLIVARWRWSRSDRGRRRARISRRGSRSSGSGSSGSGLAYLAYFRLLKRWGATRTSMVAYVLPVIGIVLGFLVRHEPIDGTLIGGPRWSSPASRWSTGAGVAGACSSPRSRSRPPSPERRRDGQPSASRTAPPTISADAPIRRTVRRDRPPRRAAPRPRRPRTPRRLAQRRHAGQWRDAQRPEDQQVRPERQPAADRGSPDLLAPAVQGVSRGDEPRPRRTSAIVAVPTGSRRTASGSMSRVPSRSIARVRRDRHPGREREARSPGRARADRAGRPPRLLEEQEPGQQRDHPDRPADPEPLPEQATPNATASSGAVPRAIG